MDLLKPADLTDSFTRALYKIAPYQGCAHGCRYCDGRAERYYVEGDFERDIVDRSSCPSRLETDLPKVRERGMVAFGSGTTDPYQPRESELNLTGSCARLLATGPVPPVGRLPALVMTKSALALRDLPYWKTLAAEAGFLLLVSLTSLEEDIRAEMEPGASSFAERLALIRAFKEAGCSVGILAMPFLPGLTDDEAGIRRVYDAAADLGVDFVMPGGLTLRPGRQKEFYLAALERHRPDLLTPTLGLYRNEAPSGAPLRTAARTLHERITRIRRDFALPFLLPHKIYATNLPAHDSLRLLLRDMVELYSDKGVDTQALRTSADAYDRWLVAKRREFRRSRRLPPTWLEDLVPDALASGELKGILRNDKLWTFCATVVLEGARLDYLSLKLETQS